MSEPIITQAELDELRHDCEVGFTIEPKRVLTLLDLITKQREALMDISMHGGRGPEAMLLVAKARAAVELVKE